MKTRSKKENKFGILKVFLISLVFAVAYFFIITSFFQGWQNAKFFDGIPDMLIFTVSFALFLYSFGIKDEKTGFYLGSGAFLISLARLIELPLQEYQWMVGVQNVNPLFWVPSALFNLTGFLLILIAFGGIKKC